MNKNFIANCFALVRPKQWLKNAFCFAPLFFSGKLINTSAVISSALVFIAFSLSSGGVYAFNDVIDCRQDQAHPIKRKRPVASGAVSVIEAIIIACVFSLLGVIIAWEISALWAIAIYILIQIAYSIYIKHIVIIDILVVAFGFVLRVFGGGAAIDVEVSPWLILCTFLLALFLATTKRRQELLVLPAGTAERRFVLDDYSLPFVDQIIGLETPVLVIAYAIYTISPATISRFGTSALIYTLPFVLYGILRYLYLIYQRNEIEDPTDIVYKDPALIVDVFLWLVVCAAIIYGSSFYVKL